MENTLNTKCKTIVALLGENPTNYSMSRVMWNFAFACHQMNVEYIPMDISEKDLDKTIDLLFELNNCAGFNVTNPYKNDVANRCDIILDCYSQEIASVNTVTKDKKGYSTDGYGVINAIGESALTDKNILVIGAGGTGSAIALALSNYGLVSVANRTLEKAIDLSCGSQIVPVKLYSSKFYSVLSNSDVVINTLPIEKTKGDPILTIKDLSGKPKTCMDVVYGHKSYFLENANFNGHVIIDGKQMLLHQAVKSFEFMFGMDVTKPMKYALDNFKYDTPNEVLIESVRKQL